MFTTEGGSCKLDGETLYVYYFADNDARDNYLDIGGDFGGLYLIGDGYVIEGKRATLDALQDDIGGAFSDE
ncbi:unannotated protein [freshwater metagenome]|uniref:Unannotated protein n=1 Tax=freshwater metagenome TaxID=449393 RepID=A0A6J6SE16_9ZZZZ